MLGFIVDFGGRAVTYKLLEPTTRLTDAFLVKSIGTQMDVLCKKEHGHLDMGIETVLWFFPSFLVQLSLPTQTMNE